MLVLCCQTVFSVCLCGGGKRVWSHSQYRVVSACHDFHGMLIDKINTTLIPSVILLISVINKSYAFKCVLMDSNSTPIIKLMCHRTSQYWLYHQTLFLSPQRQVEKWSGDATLHICHAHLYNCRTYLTNHIGSISCY